jgi:tetratricopeptide (TPR) repeat protein
MEVTGNPRIEELRRRVQTDPTSIAFAQLAEEFRRMGNYQDAIDTCRSGLAHHPSYLSARVTLGRSLMELHQYNDAHNELEAVLDLAPDNLAAIRALADIHQRRGDSGETFHSYATTLDSKPGDALPPPRIEVAEPAAAPPPLPGVEAAEPTEGPPPRIGAAEPIQPPPDAPARPPAPVEAFDALDALTLDLPPIPDFSALRLGAPRPPSEDLDLSQPTRDGSFQTSAAAANPVIAELERWLAAIVDDRSHPR